MHVSHRAVCACPHGFVSHSVAHEQSCPTCLEDLGGVHGSQRVGGEVAKEARAPVHILQADAKQARHMGRDAHDAGSWAATQVCCRRASRVPHAACHAFFSMSAAACRLKAVHRLPCSSCAARAACTSHSQCTCSTPRASLSGSQPRYSFIFSFHSRGRSATSMLPSTSACRRWNPANVQRLRSGISRSHECSATPTRAVQRRQGRRHGNCERRCPPPTGATLNCHDMLHCFTQPGMLQ